MASRMRRRLDDIDWRILAALQANARSSFSSLSRQVGLSAPATIERIRRMEDAGIISGYRLELGLDNLGYAVTAIVRVSAPEEHCVRLGALVKTLAGIVESYRVTGPDRLVLRVAASSVADLDAIMKQLSRYGTATVSVILSSSAKPVGRPMRASDDQRQSHKAGSDDVHETRNTSVSRASPLTHRRPRPRG